MKTSLISLGLLVATFVVGACHTKERSLHPAQPADKPELAYGLTKEQQRQPIVRFGDRTVTLRQFAERLSDLPPYQAARYDSPERHRQFLDDLVRFELLAAEPKGGVRQASRRRSGEAADDGRADDERSVRQARHQAE
jgi:hypothetical protein